MADMQKDQVGDTSTVNEVKQEQQMVDVDALHEDQASVTSPVPLFKEFHPFMSNNIALLLFKENLTLFDDEDDDVLSLEFLDDELDSDFAAIFNAASASDPASIAAQFISSVVSAGPRQIYNKYRKRHILEHTKPSVKLSIKDLALKGYGVSDLAFRFNLRRQEVYRCMALYNIVTFKPSYAEIANKVPVLLHDYFSKKVHLEKIAQTHNITLFHTCKLINQYNLHLKPRDPPSSAPSKSQDGLPFAFGVSPYESCYADLSKESVCDATFLLQQGVPIRKLTDIYNNDGHSLANARLHMQQYGSLGQYQSLPANEQKDEHEQQHQSSAAGLNKIHDFELYIACYLEYIEDPILKDEASETEIATINADIKSHKPVNEIMTNHGISEFFCCKLMKKMEFAALRILSHQNAYIFVETEYAEFANKKSRIHHAYKTNPQGVYPILENYHVTLDTLVRLIYSYNQVQQQLAGPEIQKGDSNSSAQPTPDLLSLPDHFDQLLSAYSTLVTGLLFHIFVKKVHLFTMHIELRIPLRFLKSIAVAFKNWSWRQARRLSQPSQPQNQSSEDVLPENEKTIASNSRDEEQQIPDLGIGMETLRDTFKILLTEFSGSLNAQAPPSSLMATAEQEINSFFQLSKPNTLNLSNIEHTNITKLNVIEDATSLLKLGFTTNAIVRRCTLPPSLLRQYEIQSRLHVLTNIFSYWAMAPQEALRVEYLLRLGSMLWLNVASHCHTNLNTLCRCFYRRQNPSGELSFVYLLNYAKPFNTPADAPQMPTLPIPAHHTSGDSSQNASSTIESLVSRLPLIDEKNANSFLNPDFARFIDFAAPKYARVPELKIQPQKPSSASSSSKKIKTGHDTYLGPASYSGTADATRHQGHHNQQGHALYQHHQQQQIMHQNQHQKRDSHLKAMGSTGNPVNARAATSHGHHAEKSSASMLNNLHAPTNSSGMGLHPNAMGSHAKGSSLGHHGGSHQEGHPGGYAKNNSENQEYSLKLDTEKKKTILNRQESVVTLFLNRTDVKEISSILGISLVTVRTDMDKYDDRVPEIYPERTTLSNLQEAQILEMFTNPKDPQPIEIISEELGVPILMVYAFLRYSGHANLKSFSFRHRTLTPSQNQNLIQNYQEGVDASSLAKLFGVSKALVKETLKKANIHYNNTIMAANSAAGATSSTSSNTGGGPSSTSMGGGAVGGMIASAYPHHPQQLFDAAHLEMMVRSHPQHHNAMGMADPNMMHDTHLQGGIGMGIPMMPTGPLGANPVYQHHPLGHMVPPHQMLHHHPNNRKAPMQTMPPPPTSSSSSSSNAIHHPMGYVTMDQDLPGTKKRGRPKKVAP